MPRSPLTLPILKFHLGLLLTLAALSLATNGLAIEPETSPYSKWRNGPPVSPDFFPIAVWLQSPHNAEKFKAAGINVYVGLWQGPTEEQLAELKRADMRLICSQNETARKHKDDPLIIGWMHGDEPDNAQEIPGGKGYGPPIPPAKIVADYEALHQHDNTRPILLNLGQGVAWDGWHGRGVRSRHPEDYVEYVRGCDIVSFDIYPGAHDNKEVAGKLWFVGDGVKRLKQWTHGKELVWNCIECTGIGAEKPRATPAQVKAEVWMSLISGSQGLIYFVHQFKPKFIEAGLLADPEMLAAVTAINREIHSLAPVLNSPTLAAEVTIQSDAGTPIEVMAKRHGGSSYLFAVETRGHTGKARFQLAFRNGNGQAEVIGENRTVAVTNGSLEDSFPPWGVHLYRAPETK
ncbi:MAG TPA: hypothetical protein VHH73_07120 [Verrucomicrobiae bacterium]|nr:hypothetical protein [Verrucomicrobiae bacterium]